MDQVSTAIQEFASGRIWVKWIPYRFVGMPLGTRMTVVRLGDDRLWIHTPLRLDESLKAEIDPLGKVGFLIAPNRLHDLYPEDFSAYPDARVFASPLLYRKQSRLPWAGVLEDSPRAEWKDELDQVVLRGSSYMDEVVFLHRETRTLILADLLERFDGSSNPVLNGLAKWGRVFRRYGLTRDQRMLIRDRAAFRSGIEAVLSWDFDAIILSHGPLVRSGGKEIFRESFRWLF